MPNTPLTLQQIINRTPSGCLLIPFEVLSAKIVGKQSYRFIKCICTCGTITTPTVKNFINGISKSCGCVRTNILISRNTKYFNNNICIANIYKGILKRCYNSKSKDYKNYGGRGVIMCQEWKNDYQKFLDWCLSNGYKKGLELDKDKIGSGLIYSPTTCCFLTRSENAKYKRTSIKKAA